MLYNLNNGNILQPTFDQSLCVCPEWQIYSTLLVLSNFWASDLCVSLLQANLRLWAYFKFIGVSVICANLLFLISTDCLGCPNESLQTEIHHLCLDPRVLSHFLPSFGTQFCSDAVCSPNSFKNQSKCTLRKILYLVTNLVLLCNKI